MSKQNRERNNPARVSKETKAAPPQAKGNTWKPIATHLVVFILGIAGTVGTQTIVNIKALNEPRLAVDTLKGMEIGFAYEERLRDSIFSHHSVWLNIKNEGFVSGFIDKVEPIISQVLMRPGIAIDYVDTRPIYWNETRQIRMDFTTRVGQPNVYRNLDIGFIWKDNLGRQVGVTNVGLATVSDSAMRNPGKLPVFKWSPVKGAEGYYVTLSEDTIFTKVVSDWVVSETWFVIPPGPLKGNAKYYVRIGPVISGERKAYTVTGSFIARVAGAPPSRTSIGVGK